MITTNDLTQALLKDPLQRVSAETLSPGFWQQVQNNHREKYGCTLPLSEIATAIKMLIARDDLYDLDLLLLDRVPNFNIFNERKCNIQALKSHKSKKPKEPKETTYHVENFEIAKMWFLGLPRSEQHYIRETIINRLYQIHCTYPWGDDPFEWHLGQSCLVEKWKLATDKAYSAFYAEYNHKLYENGRISE